MLLRTIQQKAKLWTKPDERQQIIRENVIRLATRQVFDTKT